MTQIQRETLNLIIDFTKKHGYSPSLQELADKRGVSKITMMYHLRALEKYGFIKRSRYASRQIDVLKAEDGCCATCGRPL